MKLSLKAALLGLATLLAANPVLSECSCSEPQGNGSGKCVVSCCKDASEVPATHRSHSCSGLLPGSSVPTLRHQPGCAVASSQSIQQTAVEKKIGVLQLTNGLSHATDLNLPVRLSGDRRADYPRHSGPARHLLIQVFRI